MCLVSVANFSLLLYNTMQSSVWGLRYYRRVQLGHIAFCVHKDCRAAKLGCLPHPALTDTSTTPLTDTKGQISAKHLLCTLRHPRIIFTIGWGDLLWNLILLSNVVLVGVWVCLWWGLWWTGRRRRYRKRERRGRAVLSSCCHTATFSYVLRPSFLRSRGGFAASRFSAAFYPFLNLTLGQRKPLALTWERGKMYQLDSTPLQEPPTDVALPACFDRHADY